MAKRQNTLDGQCRRIFDVVCEVFHRIAVPLFGMFTNFTRTSLRMRTISVHGERRTPRIVRASVRFGIPDGGLQMS